MNRIVAMMMTLLVVVLALGAAGCSPVVKPGVQKIYTENSFTPKQLGKGGAAVGGFVLAQGTRLYATADLPDLDARFDHQSQCFQWGLLIDAAWQRLLPGTPLEPFTVFRTRTDPAALNHLLDRFADQGAPEPELLRGLQTGGQKVRYLLLARVDRDVLEYDTTGATSLPGVDGGLGRVSDLGRDPAPASRPLGPKVRRAVTVTLEMFDLKDGKSVWEGRVEREDRKTVEPRTPADAGEFKVEKLDQGRVAFSRDEVLPDSPELVGLLEECLEALLKQMVDLTAPNTDYLNAGPG